MFKEIRGQILVWIGIIGGALTIVNHWSNFITLANWTHWVVTHFSDITHTFWTWLGSIFSVTIPKRVSIYLSLLTFFASLTIGTLIAKPVRTSLQSMFHIIMQIIVFALAAALWPAIGIKPLINFTNNSMYVLLGASIFIFVVSFSNEGSLISRLYLGALMVVLIFLTLPLSETPVSTYENLTFIERFLLSVVVLFSVYVPILVTDTGALAQRITFLLIGVAIIFGLSEVSKQVEKLRTAATSVAALAQ